MGPIDVLDHAARFMGYGSKMGVDATRKWKGEGFSREWPAVIEMSSDIKERVDKKWAKLGL
jgi:4-hydroxy-3-polyprenylbenzoate decarboxylase